MEVNLNYSFEANEVTLSETASSADLGGSSKYSSEMLEGRRGERFLVNSNWTRVSRSQEIGEAYFKRFERSFI